MLVFALVLFALVGVGLFVVGLALLGIGVGCCLLVSFVVLWVVLLCTLPGDTIKDQMPIFISPTVTTTVNSPGLKLS